MTLRPIRRTQSERRKTMFDTLLSKAQSRLDKRRRYNRVISEIMSLSDRDIADLRADRSQMLRDARQEIYG
jgi:hypothetical protein